MSNGHLVQCKSILLNNMIGNYVAIVSKRQECEKINKELLFLDGSRNLTYSSHINQNPRIRYVPS